MNSEVTDESNTENYGAEGRIMGGTDHELERRVLDILAVVLDDIDAVRCEVEDGIAYLEGVVPSEQDRDKIARLLAGVRGLRYGIICLSTERIIKAGTFLSRQLPVEREQTMKYHSLS